MRLLLVLRLLAAALLLICVGISPVMAGFGSCPLTGRHGEASVVPVTPGRLTVEVNLPAPGWWDGDGPDSMEGGFEYCLAANIAHRLGLGALEVVNVAFDALVAGHTRHFDLALSEISITPERRRAVDFSVPYFASNIGILARRGVSADARGIKRLRLGVQGGTTGASFVEEKLKPDQPPLVFADTTELFTALLAKQVDAAVNDVSLVLGAAAASHGRFFVAGQYRTGEVYGAIFPKGSPNAPVLNEIIGRLVRDGTVRMLEKRYLAGPWGADPDKIPILNY